MAQLELEKFNREQLSELLEKEYANCERTLRRLLRPNLPPRTQERIRLVFKKRLLKRDAIHHERYLRDMALSKENSAQAIPTELGFGEKLRSLFTGIVPFRTS